MKARGSLIAAALAVGAGLALASPSAAVADGTGHSLVIESGYKGTTALVVCKDWGDNANVATSCPSRTANVPEGRNTRDLLGWSDTDGARVPAGYKLMCDVVGPDWLVYSNGHSGSRWKKMSPYVSCPGNYARVYLVRR